MTTIIESQTLAILDALKTGPLTPIEALQRFACFRLAARIHDLRECGHLITTTMLADEATGKRYAQYHLVRSSQVVKKPARELA